MTEQYAKQLLDLRVQRLQWKEYDHFPRNLIIQPKQSLTVDGNNQLFLLISCDPGLVIESQLGYYNESSKESNELDEEFFGKIVIRNRRNVVQKVRFLQAVPRLNQN